MKIYEIIELIRAAKGKDKLLVIEDHKDNGLLKEVVRYTYDKTLSFHIKEIPEISSNQSLFEECETKDLYYALGVLAIINNNGSAGQKEKLLLAEAKSKLSKSDQKVLDLIVRRDLQCGASLSTFRKVFGKNFVPDFPTMLCSSYDKDKIKKNINFPAFSQLKSDGARCMVVKSARSTEARSRNGKKYFGLDVLIKSIQDRVNATLGDHHRCVLDGELVVVDSDGSILPREIGNGILNKSIKNTISQEEADRVRFIVWDIIDECKFFNGKSVIPYTTRFEMVTNVCGGSTGRMMATHSKIVNSIEEAKRHYHELTNKGEEGTILKDFNGEWVDSRSTTQFKFKEEHEADLKIVDWYHGKKGTKYENLIGGLTVESSCGKIKSNVGSGLTDDQRKLNPEDLLDSIVEVIYNTRSKSEGSETEALFLPRVVEFRFDKDNADSRDDLINREIVSREIKDE